MQAIVWEPVDARGGPLSAVRQIFFDVSFTRTQSANVGITRTVNRLLEEFKTLAPETQLICLPVAFHTQGFRSLSDALENIEAPGLRVKRSFKEVALHWITKGPIRGMVAVHFPFVLRRLAWLLYSRWEFNRQTEGLSPIEINTGDVLFLCDVSWNYQVWSAARSARKRGAKVITVVYDLIPLRQPQFCPALTVSLFRTWLRRLIPESDGIICISRAVEDDLEKYAAETGISLPPTANCRLGCDPVSVLSGAKQARSAVMDFFKTNTCFTAVGSFEPRKNYGFLLDAFEGLWSQQIQARLLIVGRPDSQCRDLLKRVEHHAELGKRLMVVFDGTDAEVAFAYANSRALIFPSLAEGFGLPLVEARARGCRVIVSDLPVFAELADAGVSIFPRESQEALKALVLSHLQEDHPVQAMIPFTWSDSARRCFGLINHFALQPGR